MEEPTETVTDDMPSHETEILGTTLIPQFWELLEKAKKTQNNNVNNILYKIIK